MIKRIYLFVILTMAVVIPSAGQALWVEGEFKYAPTKKIGLSAEAEYRSFDKFDGSQRFAAGIGADYKLFKFLKADIGYDYIRQHCEQEITKKGNIIPSYWVNRHRVYASLSGKIKLGNFELSLRERYQFTRRLGKWVPKFAPNGIKPKDDEYITYKTKQVLRSRIACDYNIRKSDFTPFVSIELYDNLAYKFELEKIRYTAGCQYKINKHNQVELFYRFIDVTSNGDSEDRGNVIGVGYTFKL